MFYWNECESNRMVIVWVFLWTYCTIHEYIYNNEFFCSFAFPVEVLYLVSIVCGHCWSVAKNEFQCELKELNKSFMNAEITNQIRNYAHENAFSSALRVKLFNRKMRLRVARCLCVKIMVLKTCCKSAKEQI